MADPNHPNVTVVTVEGPPIPDIAALTSTEAQTALLATIADGAYAKWVRLAQTELTGTRSAYIDGLQYTGQRGAQGASIEAVITLVGEMPNLIEQGQAAYDMHDTLLGPNVPVAPRGQRGKHPKAGGGFYRAIPFRHQGPDSTGIHSAPMGSAYSETMGEGEAYNLGQAIYKAAKKLKPTLGQPAGKVQWGGKLPAGMAPKLRPHHATDIYAGMYKQRKTYKSATQSQYVTFRTISTGSPGWVRKATEGKHFAEQVQAFTETKILPGAVKAFLRAAAGGSRT